MKRRIVRSRRLFRALRAFAGAAALVAAGGCALVAGLADDRAGYPDDAATTANTDARTSTDGAPCDGGASCANACDRNVFYVSVTTGNNANDGCASSRPKKTFMGTRGAVSAAASAMSASGNAQEIHACKGVYTETGISTAPSDGQVANVSLHGGYDCTSWTRTASSGDPTVDATNLTVLRGMVVPKLGSYLGTSALTVSGVAVDGFRIEAPDSPVGYDSVGVELQGLGAQLSNCDIASLSTSATNAYGIELDKSASATATANHVTSGGGTTTTVGVYVDDGASANLVASTVTVNANASSAAYGVFVKSADNTPARSTIRTNTITSVGSTGSTGIFVGSAGVDIVGNIIQVGTPVCSGSSCETDGIRATDSSTKGHVLLIAANRIAQTGVMGNAISISGSSSAAIFDNALAATGGSESTGIALFSVLSATITNNTVFATSRDIYLDALSTAAVANNLFLGDDASSGTRGLDLSACGGQTSLHNNAFLSIVDLTDAIVADGGSCSNVTSTTAAGVNSLGNAGGNIRIAMSCAGDEDAATCVPTASCATADTCIAPIIGTWTSSAAEDAGADADTPAAHAAASVTSANGWALATGTPCAIALGGQALDPSESDAGVSATVDILGKTRSTATPSIGAYELRAMCTR